ncbi:hypothetical protein MPF_1816 [Methanohalophilus portucalensis FDF-1]|uniref:Uncharacterized protein n=1 Tax=Methanohalophilus portucalensis FDF-1 TaxID=523843 RepID=A0A1L9C2L1_9EURY|nr:hypothetical protein MPF_1816 [Methanohalophilus portucalensis FDF-1]
MYLKNRYIFIHKLKNKSTYIISMNGEQFISGV